MDLLGKILENQTETNSQLNELVSRVQIIETKIETLQMETAYVEKLNRMIEGVCSRLLLILPFYKVSFILKG